MLPTQIVHEKIEKKNSPFLGFVRETFCNSSSSTVPNGFKFTHRWTIEDAQLMYFRRRGKKNLSCTQCEAFGLPNFEPGDGPQFCVQFFPNGIYNSKERDEVSLFLHLHSDQKVNLKCTFSIIGYESEKLANEEVQGEMDKYNNQLGMEKFLTRKELTNLEKGYIVDGKLTILCSIEIFELDRKPINIGKQLKILDQFTSNGIPKYKIESTSNARAEVFTKQIDMEVEQFLEIRKNVSHMESREFSPENLNNIVFNLNLWPNGRIIKQKHSKLKECHKNHLSLLLKLKECDLESICMHSCMSVLDRKKRKLFPQWIHGELSESNYLALDRFVHHSKLLKSNIPILNDDSFKINCEVEVIRIEQNNRSNSTKSLIINYKVNCESSIVIQDGGSISAGNIELNSTTTRPVIEAN